MRNLRDPLKRAGRETKLSKVLAQCNRDAARMEREREQRAKTDKPATVVVGAKEQ